MLKPLGDRVLVRRNEKENRTPAGIIIPEESLSESDTGIILNTGTKVKNVKINDSITFSKYGHSEITIDGEKLLIMREENILGIINE